MSATKSRPKMKVKQSRIPKADPPAPRYELREGFRIKVSAQVVGEQIEALKAANGGEVRPADVVEVARPVDAPLHPEFEWDDRRAAERYREDQARYVVRSYYVVQPASDDQPETRTIANVCVARGEADERDRVYVSSSVAMSEDDLREQVIAEVTAMLRGVHNRYRHLPGLKGVLLEAVERLELPE